MGLNMDLVKKRLNKINNANNSKSYMWRPEDDSETTIRIVPFKHNLDYPFIELMFYYNFGRQSFVSPSSFGDPDPVLEFAEELKSTGDRDDWIRGAKLEPKLRTYVPVVVRGEESEGVKFYGFGKTVYERLLTHIQDPDYGDISDPMEGHDIKIIYK